MKKDLMYITEEEVKTICEFYGEPFLSFMSNIHGKWTTIGLAASINTTSTCNGSNDDSYIQIFYDGRVILSRNNGRYGGMRDEVISPLITIDYLRSKGYEFKYEIPKKLERKMKLDELDKTSL